MTTTEAKQALEAADERLCEAREALLDAIEDARRRLREFDAARGDYDFEGLRDMGFLGRNECAQLNEALSVMRAADYAF